MSVTRVSESHLDVDDLNGDGLSFIKGAAPGSPYAVVVVPEDDDGTLGTAVGITLDDGLALLSFLADALGVERYVPGGGAS